MPAPITARATNPTRHSKGSVLVYSAKPPHTPPSTLLVVLRRSRRCGTPAAGASGAGCQDGWSAPGGSPEEGRSEPGQAIAKSAFRGLTCSDGKQQAESDRPSHRLGGPPAWGDVDGSEVRAM